MYALDEAWNARDWDTFDAYHDQSGGVTRFAAADSTFERRAWSIGSLAALFLPRRLASQRRSSCRHDAEREPALGPRREDPRRQAAVVVRVCEFGWRLVQVVRSPG
jgi:hypothetical protein